MTDEYPSEFTPDPHSLTADGGLPGIPSPRPLRAQKAVGPSAAGQGGSFARGAGALSRKRGHQTADLPWIGNEPEVGKVRLRRRMNAHVTPPLKTWREMNREERRSAILHLRVKDGLSARQIAKELCAPSKDAVLGEFHRMKQAGITVPESRVFKRPINRMAGTTEDIKRLVIKLRRERRSIDYIAGEIGMTASRVDKLVSDLKREGRIPDRTQHPPHAPGRNYGQAGRGATRGGVAGVKRIAQMQADARGEAKIIARADAFLPIPGTTPVPALTTNGCKWAVDGLHGKGLLWCGEPRLDGRPWCASHQRLACVPVGEAA